MAGVVLQHIQTEDPRPALAYYSVISALLLSVTSALRAGGIAATRAPLVSAGAAVGVSSLVFWVAIAPVTGLGHTWLAAAATMTLHAVLPVWLVGCRQAAQVWRSRGARGLLEAVALPSTYLAGLLIARVQGHEPPYDFVNPEAVGWAVVALSVVGIGTLHVAAAKLLWPLDGSASHNS